MTNMKTPGDRGFTRVLLHWWQTLNHAQYLTVDLYPGTALPISDWVNQTEQDQAYYYGLDLFDQQEMREFMELAELARGIDSVLITTALDLTCRLDPDLTHAMEIPGVWIARCQKT